MTIKSVQTDHAPKSIGAYSQAVRAGGFLFCSGQIPVDPTTGEVCLFDGDAGKQARLVLQNLGAVLAADGLSFEQVVKTTIYLTSMEDFGKVNEVYTSFFPGHKPARACLAVAELPKGVNVEIDAVGFAG